MENQGKHENKMNTMSQCLCLVFVCFWTFWGTILALDVLPQKEKYLPDYNFYHNISQTEKDLKSIALLYPDFVRIEWMYRSRNDAPQLVTHITNFSLPFFDESPNEGLGYRKILSPKVLVLFSYGEHAREFFPVESCFHLLKNLTDGLKAKLGSYEETFTRSVLRRFDIYAIVMANPDGRSYIESSQNFCWRGTSRGVDLNRNFDWQFAKSGSSNDPEDEEYRGPLPFSGSIASGFRQISVEILHFVLAIFSLCVCVCRDRVSDAKASNKLHFAILKQCFLNLEAKAERYLICYVLYDQG